jgi:hypothetical protein
MIVSLTTVKPVLLLWNIAGMASLSITLKEDTRGDKQWSMTTPVRLRVFGS